jgi:hypothetical protein
MDRATLEDHSAMAERHVAEGETHVARQREIVTGLANEGRDLRSAQALLAQFEAMLANHILDRDRVRAELAADDRARLRERAKRILSLADRARAEGNGDYARMLAQIASEILAHAAEMQRRDGKPDWAT